MRILHLTRDFPPKHSGGISTAVSGLCRALVAAGHECLVLSFDAWRPKAKPGQSSQGVLSRELPYAGLTVLRIHGPHDLVAAEVEAVSFTGDVLHLHDSFLFEFADNLPRRSNCPLVETVHVCQRYQAELRGLSELPLSAKAQATSLQAVDAVLVPSPAAAEVLLAGAPELDCRLYQVKLGVDDSPAAARIRAARATADAASTGRRGALLFVGRVSDIKGMAELGQALTPIFAEQPDLRLHIAGGLPASPRSQRRWQRKWTERFKPVAERCEFLGWLSPHELAEAFAEARVLLAPSWFETFGLAVAEAMLFELPIVSTRCGGVESLIEDGRHGRLAKPRDPDALELCIRAALAEPERNRAMAVAGAQRLRTRFTWAESAQRHLEVYERVVRAQNVRP